jgi:hypothetical protein
MDETLKLLQAWRDAESVLSEETPETADWLRARVAVEDAREAYQDRVNSLREAGAELAREPRLSRRLQAPVRVSAASEGTAAASRTE